MKIKKKVEPFYLTLKGVCEMTSLGKSSISRMEKQGQFPKRITLNKTRVVWIYTDVYEWCMILKKSNEYPLKGHYEL